MRMYLVLDSGGNIVAAVRAGIQEARGLPGLARTDEESKDVVWRESRVIPESGQTVYNVELPSELERLTGVDLQQALMSYQVKPVEAAFVGEAGEAELVLPDSEADQAT